MILAVKKAMILAMTTVEMIAVLTTLETMRVVPMMPVMMMVVPMTQEPDLMIMPGETILALQVLTTQAQRQKQKLKLRPKPNLNLRSMRAPLTPQGFQKILPMLIQILCQWPMILLVMWKLKWKLKLMMKPQLRKFPKRPPLWLQKPPWKIPPPKRLKLSVCLKPKCNKISRFWMRTARM